MSWLARIFGIGSKAPTSHEVVSAYGATLETAQRGFSGLLNVAELPFEKEVIKRAILDVAVEFHDDPERISALGRAYAMLGSFQALSNSPMRMPDPKDIAAMNEAQFKKHLEGMMGGNDGDSSDRKLAIAETVELENEWDAYLTSLGVPNA